MKQVTLLLDAPVFPTLSQVELSDVKDGVITFSLSNPNNPDEVYIVADVQGEPTKEYDFVSNDNPELDREYDFPCFAVNEDSRAVVVHHHWVAVEVGNQFGLMHEQITALNELLIEHCKEEYLNNLALSEVI